jgi:hypothetical protein
MRVLGVHAAVAVALLSVAVTTSPVGAQASDLAPAGTTTTVRTDCLGDPGTIVLRQTLLGSGATRVVVLGHGVHDGRWAGAFSPRASSTDRDVDIDVTAVDHEFRTSLVVDDVTADTNATLVQGFKRACAVGRTLRARSTSLASASIALVARHRAPGELITRGVVVGCEDGSRWSYATSVTYGDSGAGAGSNGLVCRDGQVTIPRTVGHADVDQTVPDALSLVVRDGHGDVRRIRYRASTPAG